MSSTFKWCWHYTDIKYGAGYEAASQKLKYGLFTNGS